MFPSKSTRASFLLCLAALIPSVVCSAKPGDAEVSALIGQGIWTLPKQGSNQSSGWNLIGGRTIRDPELSLHEYYRDKQAIFVIVKKDRTIADARLLPMQVLNCRVSEAKYIFINDARRYGLTHVCQVKNNSDAVVIGLARPEKGRDGCVHWTTRVRNAWEVDAKTGKLKDLSVEGVSCYLDGSGYVC